MKDPSREKDTAVSQESMKQVAAPSPDPFPPLLSCFLTIILMTY